MTWTDLSRRAATVLLVVVCLLAVPAMANAKFNSQQTASQQVGTATMSTPSGVAAYYTCERRGSTESFEIAVITFADRDPAGTSYSYRLATGSTTRDTATSGFKFAGLGGSKSADNVATTWTVTIQSKLSLWTGGAFADSVSCPANGSRSGWL